MIDKIIDNSLLDEMLKYHPYKFKSDKALRVYNMALRMGKYELADRILKKYEKNETLDTVMAFMMTLHAGQNTKANP